MSRSNNQTLINPSQIFLEWQGSTGKLKYFDKTKGEKGENVTINLPFTFLVLDKLHTIRGFSDADQSRFWSNEVKDLKKEKFTVRNKKGTVQEDFYSNLAPTLNKGACYSQSVYIAYYQNDKLTIGNLNLSGSGIGNWIEYNKGRDVYKGAVTISSAVEAKKGATKYYVPVFVPKAEISEETDSAAIELDKVLQEYLSAYFRRNKGEETTQVAEALYKEVEEPIDTFTSEYPDDLPF